jgi:hypothetical protein
VRDDGRLPVYGESVYCVPRTAVFQDKTDREIEYNWLDEDIVGGVERM